VFRLIAKGVLVARQHSHLMPNLIGIDPRPLDPLLSPLGYHQVVCNVCVNDSTPVGKPSFVEAEAYPLCPSNMSPGRHTPGNLAGLRLSCIGLSVLLESRS